MPSAASQYRISAELYEQGDRAAWSEKTAFAFPHQQDAEELFGKRIGYIGASNELVTFIGEVSGHAIVQAVADLQRCDLLIVGEGALRTAAYHSRRPEVEAYLAAGKSLVLLEPEYGLDGSEVVRVGAGVDLAIERRIDADRGGYDSYVFADDHQHPVWRGIFPEHLWMFNGAYGGEVVSQHDVVPNTPALVHARCGLHLKTAAVFEVQAGKGKIIVSRLQLRGRLAGPAASEDLFSRRLDPVLQRYAVNLLDYAIGKGGRE